MGVEGVFFLLGLGVGGGDAIAAVGAMGEDDADADAEDAIVAMEAISMVDAIGGDGGTMTSDAMLAVGCCPFGTCPSAGRRDAGLPSLPTAK